MDDSPGPEVRALLGGGALRASLGCDRAGGVGPTRVWYLLWAGTTEEEPSASAAAVPWTTAGAGEAGEVCTACALGPAAVAVAGEAPAATAAPGVEVPAGGVGPWRTHGRKE